jgi:hypothetical protein
MNFYKKNKQPTNQPTNQPTTLRGFFFSFSFTFSNEMTANDECSGQQTTALSTWNNRHCHARSLCAPIGTNNTSVCSCKYNSFMLEDNSDGSSCIVTIWTGFLIAFWFIVAIYVLLLVTRTTMAILSARKHAAKFRLDTLVLTGILSTAASLIIGIDCVMWIALAFISNRSSYESIDFAFLLMQGLLVLIIISTVMFFGLSMLMLLRRVDKLTIRRSFKSRTAIVATTANGTIAITVMGVLVWSKQYAIGGAITALWALACWAVYLRVSNWFERDVANATANTVTTSGRRVFVVVVMARTARLVAYGIFLFVIGTVIYSTMWFVGRAKVSQVMLAHISALGVVLQYIAVTWMMTLICNTVILILRNRNEPDEELMHRGITLHTSRSFNNSGTKPGSPRLHLAKQGSGVSRSTIKTESHVSSNRLQVPPHL